MIAPLVRTQLPHSLRGELNFARRLALAPARQRASLCKQFIIGSDIRRDAMPRWGREPFGPVQNLRTKPRTKMSVGRLFGTGRPRADER